MRTIVTGYDGSPAARVAVEHAVERARPDGKVVVVHAFEVPAEYLGSPTYQQRLDGAVTEAQELMDALETEVPALTGVEHEPDVVEGLPAEVICRVAELRGAQEIVIGSRGVGRVRALLGSVAHDVLHHAACPVLVIPERALAERETAVA